VYDWYIPLVNLSLNSGDEIHVSEHFAVSTFGDDVKNRIWEDRFHLHYGFEYGFPAEILSKIRYCLKTQEEMNCRKLPRKKAARDIAQRRFVISSGSTPYTMRLATF